MDIGETWGYRERANDSVCPIIPAEVLQFGPPRSQKVRVVMRGGEYSGLDMWVPRVRLRVLWAESEAWLRDEGLMEAALAESADAWGTLEYEAALLTLAACPIEDMYVGWGGREAGTIHIERLNETAAALGLDPQALLGEPLAFVDRRGEYVGPWAVAKRIVLSVAKAYPKQVLAAVMKEEQQLRDEAKHGRYVEWDKRTRPSHVPAERCAEYLLEREPLFALVREWCGAEAVQQFDELVELRAEVAKLNDILDVALQQIDGVGLAREARRLKLQRERRSAQ